jgi:hypothetical protein
MLAKMETNKEKINASQEWMITKMDAWIEEMKVWQKETMACQEATEACLESQEPTSFEIRESVAVHEEAPKEDAAVKTFGALKKQHGDQHLAVRCC